MRKSFDKMLYDVNIFTKDEVKEILIKAFNRYENNLNQLYVDCGFVKMDEVKDCIKDMKKDIEKIR